MPRPQRSAQQAQFGDEQDGARLQKEAEAIENSAKHELPYDVDKAMSKHLQKMADQLKDAAGDMKKLAGKPGLKSGEMRDDARDSLIETVQARPLGTLAAVVGIGFLAGYLLRRH